MEIQKVELPMGKIYILFIQIYYEDLEDQLPLGVNEQILNWNSKCIFRYSY